MPASSGLFSTSFSPHHLLPIYGAFGLAFGLIHQLHQQPQLPLGNQHLLPSLPASQPTQPHSGRHPIHHKSSTQLGKLSSLLCMSSRQCTLHALWIFCLVSLPISISSLNVHLPKLKPFCFFYSLPWCSALKNNIEVPGTCNTSHTLWTHMSGVDPIKRVKWWSVHT